MRDALGLVEAVGMVGAITAADSMVKSANVRLLELEQARGGGWTTVKVVGDVGAVQAAVEAGETILKTMNVFVSSKVIPRPTDGVVEAFGKTYVYGLKKETSRTNFSETA